MKKVKIKEEVPVGAAIFLLVVGIVLGSIFIFVTQYGAYGIEREEAISISANFESYRIYYGNHHSVSEIKINLEGYSPLYIDGACASEEVVDAVKALPQGARVDILVHPNSDTIWELKCADKTILPFEESQMDIKRENIGFGIIGIFLYFCAVLGGGALVMRWKRARKRKKR